jgi:ribosomal protein S18 acetylase RimI-like enzyme
LSGPRSSTAAEILWAAVRSDCRDNGIGTRMVEHVLDALAGDGVVLVEVKTLDRSAGHGSYEATNAFWERRGFVQVDRIEPLPGWQPGNPLRPVRGRARHDAIGRSTRSGHQQHARRRDRDGHVVQAP